MNMGTHEPPLGPTHEAACVLIDAMSFIASKILYRYIVHLKYLIDGMYQLCISLKQISDAQIRNEAIPNPSYHRYLVKGTIIHKKTHKVANKIKYKFGICRWL